MKKLIVTGGRRHVVPSLSYDHLKEHFEISLAKRIKIHQQK